MFKKILFCAAHGDDEIACSGTLSRFIEEDKEIFVAVFSFAEESIPSGFDSKILHEEFDRSMNVLGVKQDNIFKYDFKVRCFPEHRQDILERLVVLKDIIEPNLVLLPTPFDFHQDHQVISEEGIRAFSKTSSIFGYEWSHYTTGFKHTTFIELQLWHLNKKIQSSKCYKSQQHRNYVTADYIISVARMRGVQANMKFAEAFETIRLKI